MEMLGRFGEMFDRLWEMIAGLGVFGRILSVVIGVVCVFVAVMSFLVPFFVYRIRREVINIRRHMERNLIEERTKDALSHKKSKTGWFGKNPEHSEWVQENEGR